MHLGTIHFLNHRMERKTGYCIMPMISLDKVVGNFGRPVHSLLHGMQMVYQILVSRLVQGW